MATFQRWLDGFCETIGLPADREPRLALFKFTDNPVVAVPSPLEIKTLYTSRVSINATHSNNEVVYVGEGPLNGQINLIPKNRHPMTIRVTLAPKLASRELIADAHYEMTRNVSAIPLQFKSLVLPWYCYVGVPILVQWDVPGAVRMVLTVDDGYGKKAELIFSSSDKTFLCREVSGRVILRFLATSENAFCMETRVINVRHAAPKIWVDHKIQCAAPGEVVSFDYEVKNKPDNVWLEAPGRGERHLIEAEGKFSVVVRQKQEDLIIMAQKYGVTSSVTISTIPWWGLELPEA